jgi:hypothetical protein
MILAKAGGSNVEGNKVLLKPHLRYSVRREYTPTKMETGVGSISDVGFYLE